jgi:azurin
MKRTELLIKMLVGATVILFFSCSGEKKEKTDNETTGSNLLKDETPAYDPKAIDANAPVVELTLKTRGNTMAEMSYDQSELKVKAGSTVKLTLINGSKDSSMQHNFVLIDKDAMQQVADAGLKAGIANQFVPNLDEVLVATKMTMPGEKTTITFPAPPPGEYKFICTYPGHYTKMNGQFLVE